MELAVGCFLVEEQWLCSGRTGLGNGVCAAIRSCSPDTAGSAAPIPAETLHQPLPYKNLSIPTTVPMGFIPT